MCSICVFMINSTTLLAPWTPKASLFSLDLRANPWTQICLTIWTMAASERGCCVPRCGKTRKDDTVLHSFPNPEKEMDRYLAWTRAVGLDTSLDPNYVYRNRRVCHSHFELKYLTWTRRLSPGAIPTLLLPDSEMARVPLIDITNRPENVSLDPAFPSTSRDSEIARVPLIDITNRPENVFLDPAFPSTSRERNILPAECTQTADVLLFFDELFDSLNGSFSNSKKKSGKNLLLPVTPKSDHGTVWSNAKKVLSTMKFISKNNDKSLDKLVTVPTVNNWLRTVNNVEYLIQKLFNEFNIKSVWMRHLNQDPLENFFGTIRSHGCRNTNPTVAGFESSFAALLINNLSGQHSPGSNCEEDNCQTIFNSMETLFDKSESEPIYTDMIEDIDDTIYVQYEEKKKNPRVLATLQFVTGYLLKKAKAKIFKNCKKCIQCLYDPNNTADFLKLREYKKGKTFLTYPSNKLIILFSRIQDLITHIIKNKPMSPNIKALIKTYLYTEVDFDFFNCEIHKAQTVDIIYELSCNFFLFNWCRDVNKIINGTRLDLDEGDIIKMLALNVFNKRKHKKPSNR